MPESPHHDDHQYTNHLGTQGDHRQTSSGSHQSSEGVVKDLIARQLLNHEDQDQEEVQVLPLPMKQLILSGHSSVP